MAKGMIRGDRGGEARGVVPDSFENEVLLSRV